MFITINAQKDQSSAVTLTRMPAAIFYFLFKQAVRAWSWREQERSRYQITQAGYSKIGTGTGAIPYQELNVYLQYLFGLNIRPLRLSILCCITFFFKFSNGPFSFMLFRFVQTLQYFNFIILSFQNLSKKVMSAY